MEELEKEKRLGLLWERDPALVGRDESVNDKFVTLNQSLGQVLELEKRAGWMGRGSREVSGRVSARFHLACGFHWMA